MSLAGGSLSRDTQVELEGRRSGSFPARVMAKLGRSWDAPNRGRRGAAVAKRRTFWHSSVRRIKNRNNNLHLVCLLRKTRT